MQRRTGKHVLNSVRKVLIRFDRRRFGSCKTESALFNCQWVKQLTRDGCARQRQWKALQCQIPNKNTLSVNFKNPINVPRCQNIFILVGRQPCHRNSKFQTKKTSCINLFVCFSTWDELKWHEPGFSRLIRARAFQVEPEPSPTWANSLKLSNWASLNNLDNNDLDKRSEF